MVLLFICQDDETPLHCAAARNNIDCLQLLVANGADVNVTDKVSKLSFDVSILCC